MELCVLVLPAVPSSLDDFLEAARAAGFGDRIVTLARGERLDLEVPAPQRARP